MKKVKVEGVEYTILPIAPHLALYSSRINTLQERARQGQIPFNELEQATKEVKACLLQLLAGTAKPKPTEDHLLEVYAQVCAYTEQVMKAAGFLRDPPKRNDSESHATSNPTGETS